MFPVRGDVRFVDGKQTLIFTGSQKAIIWLNKIFASIHESSLPGHLQKFARRSTSAPCRMLSINPDEMDRGHEESGADINLPQRPGPSPRASKTPRATHREKSPRESPRVSSANGSAVRRAKKMYRRPDTPTDLFGLAKLNTCNTKHRKTFLRGKRQVPTSPLDSTFSSRAKSNERVTSKPSSKASSPPKRKPSPLPTTPNSILAAANSSQRQCTTPRRLKSRERHPTPVSPENKSETTTTPGSPFPSPVRKSPGLYPRDGETSCSRQSLRSEPGTKLRTACTPTAPYSMMGRLSRPSSANSRTTALSTATAAAFIRKYGTTSSSSSRLFVIPEMLQNLYGNYRAAPAQEPPPECEESFEFGDHYRSGKAQPTKIWDYAQIPPLSGSAELDRNMVENVPTESTCQFESAPPECQISSTGHPAGHQDALTEDLFPVQPECPDSSAPVVTARIVTPISSDFLRTMKEEESWRQIQSPQLTTLRPAVRTRKFFRNPLFNKKAFEKKKSFSALHSLAYPDITESTFKQLSFATKKFMAKMIKPYETRKPSYLQAA